MNEPKFDVVGVNLSTNKVHMVKADLSAEDAEAVIKVAVMRRGVNMEFFTGVPAGEFKEGDSYPFYRVQVVPPNPQPVNSTDRQ